MDIHVNIQNVPLLSLLLLVALSVYGVEKDNKKYWHSLQTRDREA